MGYLRSVRQGLHEITHYYLSSTRRGGRDSRSFAQDAEGKMDWFPFGYTVHNEEVLDDDRAVVTVSTFVYAEGTLSLNRLDFDLVREDSRWKMRKTRWGPRVEITVPDDWEQKLGLER